MKADSEGFIALQVHTIGVDSTKEGKTVRWRNIRICTTDVERYLLPENHIIPQIYAKAPHYSINDVVSKRELLLGILAFISISLGVICIRKKTRGQIRDNGEIG